MITPTKSTSNTSGRAKQLVLRFQCRAGYTLSFGEAHVVLRTSLNRVRADHHVRPDARIANAKTRLTWRLLGIAGLVVTVLRLLGSLNLT